MTCTVPTEAQLMGTWYPIGTQPDPNRRIASDPNHLLFDVWEQRLKWSGYDGVNTTSGDVILGIGGAFRTVSNFQTLVGRVPDRRHPND